MVITVVLLVIALLGGCGGSQYQKQLDLGYKYLQEEKYEEAILAFNKAIDIDEKREGAYIGLADTYITGLDEHAIDDANEALKRGYEQSKSERIADAYLRLAELLDSKGRTDLAIKLLHFGFETTQDTKLQTKIHDYVDQQASEILRRLFGLCEKGEFASVAEFMATDEFKNISAVSTNDSPFIYKSNTDDEKGIGIYPGTLLYYGGYEGNVRTGTGKWMDPLGEEGFSLVSGQWSNDKPNGINQWVVNLQDGTTYSMNGNVVDGVWDGEIVEVIPNKKEFILVYDMGSVKILGTQLIDGTTMYITRKDRLTNQPANDILSDEEELKTRGIFGFY
jgi:hypothetical protein